MAIALGAFPKRFRAERGEVLWATFQDAVAAGDTNVFGFFAIVDVVIAGWRERLRTRPPIRCYLTYRFLNETLPARWHRWMLDDASGWVGLRTGLFQACAIRPVVVGVMMALFTMRPGELLGELGWPIWVGMVGYVLVGAATTKRTRRRILQ